MGEARIRPSRARLGRLHLPSFGGFLGDGEAPGPFLLAAHGGALAVGAEGAEGLCGVGGVIGVFGVAVVVDVGAGAAGAAVEVPGMFLGGARLAASEVVGGSGAVAGGWGDGGIGLASEAWGGGNEGGALLTITTNRCGGGRRIGRGRWGVGWAWTRLREALRSRMVGATESTLVFKGMFGFCNTLL
jgi:hypothetical protein